MTEIYKWFGIQVDPEATGIRNTVFQLKFDLTCIFYLVLELFDPTRNIEKAMPPITKPILAQKALSLLTRVRYHRKLSGS